MSKMRRFQWQNQRAIWPIWRRHRWIFPWVYRVWRVRVVIKSNYDTNFYPNRWAYIVQREPTNIKYRFLIYYFVQFTWEGTYDEERLKKWVRLVKLQKTGRGWNACRHYINESVYFAFGRTYRTRKFKSVFFFSTYIFTVYWAGQNLTWLNIHDLTGIFTDLQHIIKTLSMSGPSPQYTLYPEPCRALKEVVSPIKAHCRSPASIIGLAKQ